ncbi:MAG TPA: sensor histidine kinase [Devosia sp.]|nr:sensor histidine kinase [Devosia sp.]
MLLLAFVVIAALAGLVVTRLGVDRSTSSIFLGASAAHYLDVDGKATFADIAGPLRPAFTPSDGSMVNRGTEGGINSVLWLRFKAPQLPGDASRGWILSYQETRAREVSLFIGRGASDGAITQDYIQGTVDPETGRASRFAQFAVPAAEISGQEVHLRVYTRSSKRALVWLEPAEVFAASETTQMLIFGGIFGVMVALFFYLSAIGVALRDRTFAALAALVIFYCSYVASDRAFIETFFFPGNVLLSRIMSYASTFLCYATWLTFLLGYLRVGQYAPRIAGATRIVTVLCFVFALVGAVEVALNLTLTRPYSSLFGIVALVCGFFAAAWVMRFDVGRGIAFLVCWSPTIVATIARLLLDTTPASSFGLLSVYGVYGAVTFSLLTFAIVLSIDIQQRESRMRRIAESNERRFEGFANSASDGFWETDGDGRLTLLTGRFAGWVPGEAQKRLTSILEERATQSGMAGVDVLRSRLAGNSPFRGLEIELAAGGQTVELSGEHHAPTDGPSGWRGIITDVTLRNNRRHREAREQRIAAVGQLTSSVAHEVNNLLHPILNLSRRLSDRLGADDEGRRYLQLIMDSSSRAATILSRILRSVHPQTSAAAPIALSDACLRVCEEIQALTAGTVDLQYRITSEGGPLVQESEVFQVVANLVSNAIAATGNNGHVHIMLGRLAGGPYELSVTDDGTGIPAELLSQIQDPFFTTKPAGEGTGLGLSIVRDIVQGWGAELSVASGAMTGTVFTISVNAERQPAA